MALYSYGPRRYQLLVSTAHANRLSLTLEPTVGANLPVLDTLSMLVSTGHRVRRIYGSFSGTDGHN